MRQPVRIILIGPSGSGKSDVAVALASRLGYKARDSDALIVGRIGMPIVHFFERFGEAAFRAIEEQTLRDLCREEGVVIATGGGAPVSDANWLAWRPRSLVVCLTARPETLVERVRRHAESSGDAAERPLLAGDAPAKMRTMLAARAPFYAQADITIDTDTLTPDEVLDRVLMGISEWRTSDRIPSFSLGTPHGRSDIYIGYGVAARLGELAVRRWPATRRVWIVSDTNVAGCWYEPVAETLGRAGLDCMRIVVPAGEHSKSMEQVRSLSDAVTASASRRDLVVALGGGVVGDLAGFVAAISLRGLSLMQVPTSLLAMVDSSVGGKTGVNNAAGKNMVGAFYQPGIVAIDPGFLTTLPRDEYRSGMAEVIKHSIIQPSTPLGGGSLARALELAADLDPLPRDDISRVLALNVAIKRSVVQADERESGLRMILNFGHTAGHAIEADRYRYRHGEAIALGMLVAAHIAVTMDRVDVDWLARLRGELGRAGLPTELDGRIDTIVSNLARDKKNLDGSLRWILPARNGGVEVVTGVEMETIRSALRSIWAG